MRFLLSVAFAILAAAAVATANPATTYKQVLGPYQPADLAGSNSNFGRNILSSKDGKEIIVSATELDNEGAVFVYNYDIKTDSLTQTQLIVPPPGRQTGRFGSYLAMQGKYLLIADYEDNSNAGAVFIYKRGYGTNSAGKRIKQWIYMQALTGTVIHYGASASFSQNGKLLVVGADGFGGVGAFFVYRLSSGPNSQYVLVQGPVTQGLPPGSYFGMVTTTKNGQWLAVGAYGLQTYDGAVFLYKWSKAEGGFVAAGTQPFLTGGLDDDLGWALQFSPNGKTLAMCGDYAANGQGRLTIADWDAKSKRYKITQQGIAPAAGNGYTPANFCTGLAWTPDSKTLVVSEYGYDALNGALWLVQKMNSENGWSIVPTPIVPNPGAATQDTFAYFQFAATSKTIVAGAKGYPLPADDGVMYVFEKSKA